MKKSDLENLTKDQLEKKISGKKILAGIFIPLTIALFYFGIRGYFNGDELDWSAITIAICCIGGFASVYPELKLFQEELRSRD
jgi:hypothetical protein